MGVRQTYSHHSICRECDRKIRYGDMVLAVCTTRSRSFVCEDCVIEAADKIKTIRQDNGAPND